MQDSRVQDSTTGAAIERIPRSCPSCHASAAIPVPEYSEPGWPIVKCGDCSFVYLSVMTSYEALQEELSWEKTHAQEAKKRSSYWIYRLDQATRFRLKFGLWLDKQFVMRTASKGGNVLDIGCGSACRRGEGIRPFGIEISKALSQKVAPAYKSLGGRIVNAPAVEGLDTFDDDFFDHVIMRSYLEHEAQPRLVLQKTYRKLRSGGSAAVKVPDYGCLGRRVMGRKWCGFRFPDHLNYFTLRSLRQMAEKEGFQVATKNVIPGVNDNIFVNLIKP